MAIRVVLALNLGYDTGNPEVRLFVSFLNNSKKMITYYLKLGHGHFL
jgi:hypothetical protein